MSATLEELKSTVSHLPVSERAELAHYLLRTLEAPDEGAAAEWLASPSGGWTMSAPDGSSVSRPSR
jgi:hypothetical protein